MNATHAKDLDLPFLVRISKLSLANRKKALVAEIKRLGWSFIHTPRNFTRRFWLRNTTYHRRIVLGKDWSRKNLLQQCIILGHELVHVRQRKRLGRLRFLALYAVASSRLDLELSAYRASRYLGGGRVSWTWLRKFYRLGRLSETYVRGRTEQVVGNLVPLKRTR